MSSQFGKLEMLYGTGKNSFVIKPSMSAASSVVVDEDEKVTLNDIGKYYYYKVKKVKMGISEFKFAHNLIEIRK